MGLSPTSGWGSAVADLAAKRRPPPSVTATTIRPIRNNLAGSAAPRHSGRRRRHFGRRSKAAGQKILRSTRAVRHLCCNAQSTGRAAREASRDLEEATMVRRRRSQPARRRTVWRGPEARRPSQRHRRGPEARRPSQRHRRGPDSADSRVYGWAAAKNGSRARSALRFRARRREAGDRLRRCGGSGRGGCGGACVGCWRGRAGRTLDLGTRDGGTCCRGARLRPRWGRLLTVQPHRRAAGHGQRAADQDSADRDQRAGRHTGPGRRSRGRSLHSRTFRDRRGGGQDAGRCDGCRAWVKQGVQLLGQLADMCLHWRREGIQPVGRTQEVLQPSFRRHILDSEGQDRDSPVGRALDLTLDLWRVVGGVREDEHHRAALVDCVDDRTGVTDARLNVARRDPAPQPVGFEKSADRVGGRLVLRRMADEYIVRHHPATVALAARGGNSLPVSAPREASSSGGCPRRPEASRR
jgi:hypothetical protein